MAFPTTGLLDDFTGAAGADTNFTIIDGGTGFAGVNYDGAGNGITAVSTKFAWAYWNPNTAFGPDSECYGTISAVGTAANAIRFLARITGQGTANWTGYFVAAQLQTAVAWTIQRHDVGANVPLATGPVQALAVGDQMGIEIVGTVINAKYKPSGGSWTTLFSYDTSGDATQYTTAGAIGIEFGLKTSKITDFNGGTVVAGGTVTDSGTVTGTGAASAAEVVVDQAADQATGTPAGQDAVADAAAGQATLTASSAEQIQEAAAGQATASATAGEAIQDQAADQATVTPTGTGFPVLPGDAGTVVATISQSGSEAVGDAGAAGAAASPAGAERTADSAAAAVTWQAADTETIIDRATTALAGAPTGVGTVVLADQGATTITLTPTGFGAAVATAWGRSTGTATEPPTATGDGSDPPTATGRASNVPTATGSVLQG